MGRLLIKCIINLVIGLILGFILGALFMLIAFPFFFPPEAPPAEDSKLAEFYINENEENFTEDRTGSIENISNINKTENPVEIEDPRDAENETLNEGPKPTVLKSGAFNPDAKGSDTFHRGSGDVEIVLFEGENLLVFGENMEVTPGPDYKVYVVYEDGVETEDRFNEIKDDKTFRLGDIQAFDGFQTYDIPRDVRIDEIESILVWCERFGEFITVAELE